MSMEWQSSINQHSTADAFYRHDPGIIQGNPPALMKDRAFLIISLVPLLFQEPSLSDCIPFLYKIKHGDVSVNSKLQHPLPG